MAEQTPSIGRVVHYVYGADHYPAIITDPAFTVYNVQETPVVKTALAVFIPMEALPMVTVADMDPAGAPGTWHWPEFIPPKA
jgi:hypothetical protein